MKKIIRMIASLGIALHLASCGGGQIQIGGTVTLGVNAPSSEGQMPHEQRGGGYPQQQTQQQEDPSQMVGKIFKDDCFGNQSATPTPGCIKIPWVQATGPDCRYWLNDIGNGRAQLQRVPEGEVVYHNQETKETWRIKCKNRVTVALPRQPRQRPVMVQQQRVQQTIVCPPPRPMMQPGPYCPPPQPRMVVQPRPYCPPPQVRRPYCPPPQQRGVPQRRYP